MLKTGFRDERKGILTPSLSRGEGECGDGENNETFPSLTFSAVPGYLQRGI